MVSIAKATHRESRSARVSPRFTGNERKEIKTKPSLRYPYSSSTGPYTLATSSESA
jgi:hypothetical protein